jgi:hypothetical protein
MERPEETAARLARTLSVVLFAGLAAGCALVAGGLVAALAGARVSATCPAGADLLRCLRSGDYCAPMALGLLVLLATPPAAAVGLAVGFVRARQPAWAALCVLVVGMALVGLAVRLK